MANPTLIPYYTIMTIRQTPRSRKLELLERSSGSEEHPVLIDSPESPLKKRRYSSPRRQRSRESSASTESTVELTSFASKDNNPFDVDESQDLQELRNLQESLRLVDDVGPQSVLRLQRLPPSCTYGRISQQGLRTYTRMDPDSFSGLHFPMRLDKSPSVTARQWWPHGYRETRRSIPTSPSEAFMRIDTKHILANSRVTQSSSPKSANDAYLEEVDGTLSKSKEHRSNDLVYNENQPSDIDVLVLGTPTKSNRRRLSTSSLSTKSPSSVVGTVLSSSSRRRSFVDQESSLMRTPTRSTYKQCLQGYPSDDSPKTESIGSPSVGIEWSKSLETPTRKRVDFEGGFGTITNSTRKNHQELSPTDSVDELPQITDFVGWSSSLETPPKKKGSESKSRIRNEVLECLRGVPQLILSPDAKAQKGLFQKEGSFSLVSSPLVSEDDDNQQSPELRNEKEDASPVIAQRVKVFEDVEDVEQVGKVDIMTGTPLHFEQDLPATLESEIKLEEGTFDVEAGEVGFTLPGDMLQELEQDILMLPNQELQSQILSESQANIFAGISNSELSKSNEGLQRLPEPEKLSDMDTEVDSVLSGNSVDGETEEATLGKGTRSDMDETAASEYEGGLISQDLTMDNMKPEAWAIKRESYVPTDNEQGIHGDGGHQSREVVSEYEFDSLRFSQLDDGFSAILEASPRKLLSSQSVGVKKGPDQRIDDTEWRSTGATIFGSIKGDPTPDGSANGKSHQVPPSLGGGFISASGQTFTPRSKEAPARAASLFEKDDDDPGDVNNMGTTSRFPQVPARLASLQTISGFQIAEGKKPLAISKAAQEGVALLFRDEDLGVRSTEALLDDRTGSSRNMHAGSAVPQQSETNGMDTTRGSLEVPLQPALLQTFGGFQTAGGKKLPAISKVAKERAAFLFQDKDMGPEPTETSLDEPTCPSVHSGLTAQHQSEAHDMETTQGSIEVPVQPVPPQTFIGFQTAAGNRFPAISKIAQGKAALLLQDEDLGVASTETLADEDGDVPRTTNSGSTLPQNFGGFMSGGGRELAVPSKEALERWSGLFAEDDLPILKALGSVRAAPSSQLGQAKGFTGFSSGMGKALAPISKAAQERALGILEIDMPSITPPITTHKDPVGSIPSNNRLPPASLPGSRPVGTMITGMAPRQPPISPHMNNLKLKSLRAAAVGASSYSNMSMKLLPKSKTPFKPPLQFKSPMKKVLDNATSSSANNSSAGNAPPMKKTTLHPNARIMPVGRTHSPSYSSLFNLQPQGQRTSLCDTLGCPHHLDREELLSLGVPEAAIDMTFVDAQSYRFGSWGAEDAYRDLIARGAALSLLSKIWLSNHYGLIVWKLACYVRSWPQYFQSQMSSWFCPAKVLDQLAYRYEREINLAERPALRKVVEGDEAAARHMVLCIAGVTNEYSEEAKEDMLKVTVTDGWYILPATLDPLLVRAVERRKLKVGSKIHVSRAKLSSGAENGVDILELTGAGSTTTSVSIILQANNTRLARWDTKLGFQRDPLIWTTRLRSISPDGGLVPGVDVVVLRKYPVLFIETLEDGVAKIKRTAREEDRAAEAHWEQMRKQCQDIIQEVTRTFDPEANPTRVQEEIQARTAKLQSRAATRNVMPFFTIRVGDYLGSRGHEEHGRHQEALVTFWHPDHTPYQEGHRVRITSLTAKRTGRGFGLEDVLQLTGTKMSTAREMPTDPKTILLTNYRPREITACAEIEYLDQGAEVDLAVIILAINDKTVNSNKVYMVVADASRQLILVDHQISADQPLPSFLKVHAKILIANARFKMRDYKFGVDVVMSLQSYTHISGTGTGPLVSTSGISGWPLYAQPSLQQLNEMVNGVCGHGRIEDKGNLVELMARANALFVEMQPSL
ncbi:hypothetical protein BGZ65_004415 [Modicella reniformis]|uniref:Uncharacterized protein n=1 Tax=Modicella reniformis TaxID=1440133 RepID=A0A9P6MLD5_9FUNG|nr:hypothetical protein BGZ65_004415 [Modicella reniformis]